LAIFIAAGDGQGPQGGRSRDHRVVGGQRRELVRRADERAAGLLGDLRRGQVTEPRVGVEPGPDGGPAEGQLVQGGERGADAGQRPVELGRPAADDLAEGDRGGVLEMGPPQHHHVGVGAGLRPERGVERLDRRDDRALDLLDRGDVHDRRERVVRGLRAVDIVVRVDRRLAAPTGARQLVRPPGDDLVGVHVRLGARAGLEDDQRELGVEASVDDLAGRPLDEPGLVGRELAELEVRPRRAQLEDPERTDDRPAPGEPADADPEVLDRALGLGAPVAVGRDADLPEGVLLDPVGLAVVGRVAPGSCGGHAPSVRRRRPRDRPQPVQRSGSTDRDGPNSWTRPIPTQAHPKTSQAAGEGLVSLSQGAQARLRDHDRRRDDISHDDM
jgi:hypothetical protein